MAAPFLDDLSLPPSGGCGVGPVADAGTENYSPRGGPRARPYGGQPIVIVTWASSPELQGAVVVAGAAAPPCSRMQSWKRRSQFCISWGPGRLVIGGEAILRSQASKARTDALFSLWPIRSSPR